MLRALKMTKVRKPCFRRYLPTLETFGELANLDTPNNTPLTSNSTSKMMYMMLKLLKNREERSRA